MVSIERGPHDDLTAVFEREEALLLRRLVEEMRLVLSAEAGTDDVAERLFPKAYAEPDDQAAYEELMGDQLRLEKLRVLNRVEEMLEGDEITLGGDDADIWLAALNDMRLALGVRLDVTEERMGAELDPEDPDAPALSVLHWLGWVQESLLKEMRA